MSLTNRDLRKTIAGDGDGAVEPEGFRHEDG